MNFGHPADYRSDTLVDERALIMRRRLATGLVPDFAAVPESERSVQGRAMAVAWIGTVGFAMVLTLVEMGLEWAAPESLRGFLRPVVFTLAALMSTPTV